MVVTPLERRLLQALYSWSPLKNMSLLLRHWLVSLHRSSCVQHNGGSDTSNGDKLDGIVKNTKLNKTSIII